MRAIAVGFFITAFVVSAQVGCNVQDFYGLAWTLHNPSERHLNLIRWLHFNGDKCNKEQLIIIWNSLPEWAGTADSSEIRQKITSLYQLLVAKESK